MTMNDFSLVSQKPQLENLPKNETKKILYRWQTSSRFPTYTKLQSDQRGHHGDSLHEDG